VVVVLLLSVAGCASKAPRSVPRVVRYELNLVGDRGFADLNAKFTTSGGGYTGEKEFAASWSKEVTVNFPDVEFVRLDGSFTFDTSVPGGSDDVTLAALRCQIFVDGVRVDNKIAYAPSCTYRLTQGTPSPVPS